MTRRGAISNAPRAATATAAVVMKWRGGNVTIKPTHTSWRDFWGAHYDLTWITDQIDRAKSIGCNAIRIIGAVNGVVAGDYTRATYLARQQAVLDYCISLNMRYYPCGAGDYATTLTTATKDELVAHATALVGQPNIIGFDIVQEYDYWSTQNSISVATFLATTGAWYTAIKAANPALACTFSQADPTLDPTPIASYADFYDFHLYSDTVPAQFLTVNKRFIIGELGQNQAASSAARTSRYVAGAGANSRALCNGTFAWALADQSATASNQWGIFDNSGVERTDMTTTFKTFPLTRAA